MPNPADSAGRRTSLRLPWVVLGLVAAAALILGAVLKAWPVLFPPVAATAALDPDCDLRSGPCMAVFADGSSVRFGIEPRAIPVLKPLTLKVVFDGVPASGVEVDFAGTDMNMGYNRVSLERGGPGLWRGQGMLPICVRNVMNWEATVLIDAPGGLMAAPFRFDTFRD